MLSDFFRINLPYGIAKNKNGNWMAFNREYKPLGFNHPKWRGQPGEDYLDLPIYTNYGDIPEFVLLALASENPAAVFRDKENNIINVFFYDDASNPVNGIGNNMDLWDEYFFKLITLSKLIISN